MLAIHSHAWRVTASRSCEEPGFSPYFLFFAASPAKSGAIEVVQRLKLSPKYFFELDKLRSDVFLQHFFSFQ